MNRPVGSPGKGAVEMPNSADMAHQEVHFTIDGRPFSTDHPEHTAGALLKLAGLDPEGYDLGEIVPGRREPTVFEEGHRVHVHEGEEFVSIREQATVA
jgi:hypothetical protein